MKIESGVADLASIELDELNDVAALQTRRARKYIVGTDDFAAIIEAVGDELAVLEIDGRRAFQYETQYFDTPDRQLHLDTAHRRPFRSKVRTRRYDSADTAMLEVKTRNGRGATVKHRFEISSDDRQRLTHEGTIFVRRFVRSRVVERLEPSMTTRFLRVTAVDERAGTRFTFDEGLVCAAPSGRSVPMDGVIVETKSDSGPTQIDRLLWRRGLRPVRFSKYCTGMAALDPALPANHWHRTLGRHFPDRLTERDTA